MASIARGGTGFVGSDLVEERGRDFVTTYDRLEPITNDAGQALRFALIARPTSPARDKLAAGEPLSIVTSYPNTAARQIDAKWINTIPGGVEVELLDRGSDFDAGFDLVQSGETVRQNGLEIVEDDILRVDLLRGYYRK